METQVLLTLPDELVERAQQWALVTQRDLAQTLADALQLVLGPAQSAPHARSSVATLPDGEVLALTKIKMKPAQGKHLAELQRKQSESVLTNVEQTELLALMQTYNQLWIRQSEALAEAVRRGLRKPLDS